MAQRGLCSRREADRFIEQGQVRVDGRIVSTLGARIQPDQTICLSREAASEQSGKITVLLNKPPGYVSGLPEKGYPAAVRLITGKNAWIAGTRAPDRHGLAPAGRLDIDSTGLIVFTGDGRIARLLIAPDSTLEKEYHVRVEGSITRAKLKLLSHGLSLDGRALKSAVIRQRRGQELVFILTEGRKRQIRRMCEQVDLRVSGLIRVRIGGVSLGNLQRGKWRLLGPAETFTA